jgi:hypothetical protein
MKKTTKKKKAKSESAEATVASVREEMAKPRTVKSAREQNVYKPLRG